MIGILPSLSLRDEEVVVTFGRSRGPGGQNVNKVETAAILTFNISDSQSLSESQRQLISTALASRITRSGELKLRSERFRTQAENRRDVLRRFSTLLAAALTPRRSRVATRPTRGSRVRRRRAKQLRSVRKRERTKAHGEE